MSFVASMLVLVIEYEADIAIACRNLTGIMFRRAFHQVINLIGSRFALIPCVLVLAGCLFVLLRNIKDLVSLILEFAAIRFSLRALLVLITLFSMSLSVLLTVPLEAAVLVDARHGHRMRLLLENEGFSMCMNREDHLWSGGTSFVTWGIPMLISERKIRDDALLNNYYCRVRYYPFFRFQNWENCFGCGRYLGLPCGHKNCAHLKGKSWRQDASSTTNLKVNFRTDSH